MSTYLRKCIDIAPTGVEFPGAPQDYRLLRRQPWWRELLATTSHLRLWADWPYLQPSGRFALDDPRSPGSFWLLSLDAQIKQANADGLQVILLPYRYPTWVTGTDAFPRDSAAEIRVDPWDRMSLKDYLAWEAAYARDPLRTKPPDRKDVRYRLPPDGHGPTSRWGQYVAKLWDRYVAQADRFGRVSLFEVVNEPNGQLWPQRTPSGASDLAGKFGSEGTAMVVPAVVAEMMVTVDGLARSHDLAATCLAPSAAESDIGDRRAFTIAVDAPYTPTDEPLVPALFAELASRGFEGGEHWAWSYHNYSDISNRRPRFELSRGGYQRRLIAELGWKGRQLDGGPAIYATEGGALLNRAGLRFGIPASNPDARKQAQAVVLKEALARHHYAKGAGEGVAMLTQYTVYADAAFDDGIVDLVSSRATKRPAFDAWVSVPEYLPPPVLPASWAPQQ